MNKVLSKVLTFFAVFCCSFLTVSSSDISLFTNAYAGGGGDGGGIDFDVMKKFTKTADDADSEDNGFDSSDPDDADSEDNGNGNSDPDDADSEDNGFDPSGPDDADSEDNGFGSSNDNDDSSDPDDADSEDNGFDPSSPDDADSEDNGFETDDSDDTPPGVEPLSNDDDDDDDDGVRPPAATNTNPGTTATSGTLTTEERIAQREQCLENEGVDSDAYEIEVSSSSSTLFTAFYAEHPDFSRDLCRDGYNRCGGYTCKVLSLTYNHIREAHQHARRNKKFVRGVSIKKGRPAFSMRSDYYFDHSNSLGSTEGLEDANDILTQGNRRNGYVTEVRLEDPTDTSEANNFVSDNYQGTSLPRCNRFNSDPDGDGYGWENGQSCRVGSQNVVDVGNNQNDDDDDQGAASPQQNHSSGRAYCINAASADSDGDGYGWENNETCIVRNSAADK